MTSKNQGPVYDLIVVMDRQAGVRTIPTFPSSPGLSELACCRPAILFWLFVQPMHSLHRVGFRIGCLDSFKRKPMLVLENPVAAPGGQRLHR
mmetsp:Transcript_22630/g.32340  ORF Transcript_22630/g.32340 Transcript_22630/m.32340 type:complete len:92 (-) Transcript_22630:231-506(-)